MNGHPKIEQHSEKDSSLETDMRRRRRKDARILIIVIILVAVLGYFFISNLNGIYSML